MTKAEDKEYREHTIEKVTDKGEGYEICFGEGWCFYLTKQECLRVTPKVGHVIRQYGKGLGFPVRGIDIDGKECFYRTREEEKKRLQEWVKKEDVRKKAEFEANMARLDADYENLPEVFRRRIDKFRANNPDFRWKYEAYEMFVCKEAVNIATTLKTSEEVNRFVSLPSEKQRELVRISEGHSVNTFGTSCYLALIYLSNPEEVVKLHGALAPLVGSKEYGCVPRSPKEEVGGPK